ncbi:uncharacterized protein LOC110390798 [Numida meleagris]|uniref:uncharacterized protein LOC110390798 n=1 Tax=Numida meleagris TaxID=8996 RepID=UPI000B3D8D96|nr:uncharacterized protein LOC110390798 [Numida meleagris]
MLPQGFKNSPTIFGNQLAKDLEQWERPSNKEILLQYMDDFLIATKTKGACLKWTIRLLNFLGLNRYQVSLQKAQVAQQQMTYLGYETAAGMRTLGTARKETTCQTPEPHTSKELRTLLRMMGWCCLWIPNYELLVKLLYVLLKSCPKDLTWDREARRVFQQLKQELMKAPALGLPDVTKPFLLFSYEKEGIALGVLAQNLEPYQRAVAYFSKQPGEVSKGWPGCLRAVAALVINIQEAWKLTMGQKVTVLVSHTVSTVLEVKGGHWLSTQRLLKYQAILVEQDDAEIMVTNIINPASFFSGVTGEPVSHDCLETTEAVYSSCVDLKDEPLEDAEDTWYTDRSSFVRQGIHKAGHAVTTVDEVIEAKALSLDSSGQKAKIIGLTRALELAKGRRINIWTDSKYAFTHGAIWKERGLLSAQGKGIKHAEETLKLLEAVQQPEKVAIMHCRSHQKGNNAEEMGNALADQEEKQAVERKVVVGSLIPDGKVRWMVSQGI